MDVIADFAYPLPADSDIRDGRRAAHGRAMLRGFVDGVTCRAESCYAAMMAEGDRSARQFFEYLRALVKERQCAAASQSDERDDDGGGARAAAHR